MSDPKEQQLENQLKHWHQQAVMPASLRRHIQQQLKQPHRPSSSRRWQQYAALASFALALILWWQASSLSERHYQIVREQQNGHLIEVHRLEPRQPSVNEGLQLAYQQALSEFTKVQAATDAHQRLMYWQWQDQGVLLTDCQDTKVLVQQELVSMWLQQQRIQLADVQQPQWVSVTQGQQGQFLAFASSTSASHCKAP